MVKTLAQFFSLNAGLRCGAVMAFSLLAGLSSRSGGQARSGLFDPVREVDPFIGSDFGGESFVGTAVPFGMVKLGQDVEDFDGRPASSGYASSGRVRGFSHLHLSGASGKYGNVLVSPSTGELHPFDLWSARSSEKNEPGDSISEQAGVLRFLRSAQTLSF